MAVLSPVFALIYLYYYPQDYKPLFFIAFILGLLAVLSSFLLKDKRQPNPTTIARTPFFSFPELLEKQPDPLS